MNLCMLLSPGARRELFADFKRGDASLIDQLKPLRTPKEYTTAIRSLGRARRTSQALALLDDMEERGFPANIYAYAAAIDACDKGRKWKTALSLLADMRAKGLEPNVVAYTAAIAACARAGQSDEALRLFRELKAPNAHAYSAAIAACKNATALELLDEMRTAGIHPTIKAYSAALSACEKADLWEAALGVIDDMQAAGIEPDSSCFNAAAFACAAAGQTAKCLELFAMTVKKDVVSYNAALTAYEQAAMCDEAVALLDEIPEPNARSYNLAISACGKAKRVDLARRILNKAPTRTLYNAAIDACAKAADYRGALELLRAMPMQPDAVAVTAAMTACIHGGEPLQALDLFDTLEDPDTVAFNTAVAACGTDWRRALVLLKKARNQGAADVITFSSAIAACEKAGEAETAIAVLRVMEACGPPPNVVTYNAALSACAKGHQNWGTLLETFNAMTVAPDAITFQVLIQAAANANHFDAGLRLFARAPKTIATYHAALACCRSGGLVDTALDLVTTMPAELATLETFEKAIGVCVKARRSKEAVDLLRETVRRGLKPTPDTFARAVLACEEAGDYDLALAVLKKMQLRGLDTTMHVASAAIAGYETKGYITKAAATLLDADALYSSCWRSEDHLDLQHLPLPVARTVARLALTDVIRKPKTRHFHDASNDLTILTGLFRPRQHTMLALLRDEFALSASVAKDRLILSSADLVAFSLGDEDELRLLRRQGFRE